MPPTPARSRARPRSCTRRARSCSTCPTATRRARAARTRRRRSSTWSMACRRCPTSTAPSSGTTTTAATVVPGLAGPFIEITNKAGSLISDSLLLDDGGSVTWSKATDEFGDAQLDAFVFASTAKAFVRAQPQPEPRLARRGPLGQRQREPDLQRLLDRRRHPLLSRGDQQHRRDHEQLPEHRPDRRRRLSRVRSLGARQLADPRRWASSMARSAKASPIRSPPTITDDHGMGRGFFFTDAPLRDLDPAGPRSAGPRTPTARSTTRARSSARPLWELKTELVAQYGAEAGNALERKIYYGIMQRSADIPSTTPRRWSPTTTTAI